MSGSAASSRLVSLDAFRGAAVAAMLLVNNPGTWSDIYPPLRHAAWHGWTMTDLVFPSFLWIVGVAVTLATARRQAAGEDRRQLLAHGVRRAAILFVLGIFLAAFPFGLLPAHHFSFSTLRIPGVLQRIGICYVATLAICLKWNWRGQAGWALGLLAGYWALLKLVPVPGYGAGVLEAMGSLPWWIDSQLLRGHTWSGAPAPGFDPEGLLSTLPAIVTTLLGALAGRWLLTDAAPKAKAVALLAAGGAALLLGLALERWMPINKNLWTSSYAVFSAGWAMVLFAALYWILEIREWRRWAAPFVAFGMNAILLFVLSGVLARVAALVMLPGANETMITLKQVVFQKLFLPLASPVNASLLFAVAWVGGHVLVAVALARRGWFLKI